MEDIRIAAVCMRAEVGKIEENLERMEGFVSEASREGAKIVCFPELSVTGYSLNRPGGIYGDSAGPERAEDRLSRMAREAGVVVLAGIVEPSAGGKPYLTHVIAGPEGVMGLYRKTHLSPKEQDVYEAGDTLGVFSWGKCTFGVQLCYEAHFPEISTVMALQGADILFIPHASPRGTPEEKLKSWLRHLPGRAFDNGLYVVACNQVGRSGEGLSFPGVAVALGPGGGILASHAGEEERVLIADLSSSVLEEVRQHRMKYFLPRRVPSLYKEIIDS